MTTLERELDQLRELHALGAHFIAVDGAGKNPAPGYGKCVEGCPRPSIGVPSKTTHLEGCSGWKAVRLDADRLVSRWSEYVRRREADASTAYPMLGLVPSSVGLYAVDVDGLKKEPVSESEVRAALLAWGCVFGYGTDDGFVDPAGRQTSMSGGVHLFYAVERLEKKLPKDNLSWWLTPNKPTGPQTRGVEPFEPGVLLCKGDGRHADGYVAVYSVSAVHGAATSKSVPRVPIPREDLGGELRRYYYASQQASLVENSGRHDQMRDSMVASIAAGALDDPHPYVVAVHLNGKVNDGKGDTVADIQRAWDGWVKDRERCPEPPDRSRWAGGFTKKTRQRASGSRSWSNEEACVLLHEGAYADRNQQAFELLAGRVRSFEQSTYILTEDCVWQPLDTETKVERRVVATLSDEGVCRRCLAGSSGLVPAVCKRIFSDGFDDLSPLLAAFNIGGVLHAVEPMSVARERLGVADVAPVKRLRPMVPDDLNIYRVKADIGVADTTLYSRESLVERVILRGGFGMQNCCVAYTLRHLSRALEAPTKEVLMVLADWNSGKSTLVNLLQSVMAHNAAISYGGRSFEKFTLGDVQRATYVFVDEAQNLTRDSWGDLKERIGGLRAVPRRMHDAGVPRASRMSAMLFAEREVFDWSAHNGELLQRGWLHGRFRIVLAHGQKQLDKSLAFELRKPEHAAHFVWRVLSTDPDHLSVVDEFGCAHMVEAAGYVARMSELDHSTVPVNRDGSRQKLPLSVTAEDISTIGQPTRPRPSSTPEDAESVARAAADEFAADAAAEAASGADTLSSNEQPASVADASNASAGCGDCGHCEWCTAEPLAW